MNNDQKPITFAGAGGAPDSSTSIATSGSGASRIVITDKSIVAFGGGGAGLPLPSSSPTTSGSGKPTDISMKLRSFAGGHSSLSQDLLATLIAGADEIERYYGSMLAWKQTAETKDAKLSREIEDRINERVSKRVNEIKKGVESPIDFKNMPIPEIPTDELEIKDWNPIHIGLVVGRESHVRITHLPTRIQVESSDERSIHRARAVAMEKFEKAWAEYWLEQNKKADQRAITRKDIEKMVLNAIMGNSHPADDYYVAFISEDEVNTVANQVALNVESKLINTLCDPRNSLPRFGCSVAPIVKYADEVPTSDLKFTVPTPKVRLTLHGLNGSKSNEIEMECDQSFTVTIGNNSANPEMIKEQCAKIAESVASDYPESARDTAEAIRAHAFKAIEATSPSGSVLPSFNQKGNVVFKPETATFEPEVDDQPFIHWAGGECPVDPATVVDYTMRISPAIVNTSKARNLEFRHNVTGMPQDCEIISYRVKSTALKSQGQTWAGVLDQMSRDTINETIEYLSSINHRGDLQDDLKDVLATKPIAPSNDEKAMTWFNCLREIAAMLSVPDDQPITSCPLHLKRLLQDKGIAKVALDSKNTLLKSCEAALEQAHKDLDVARTQSEHELVDLDELSGAAKDVLFKLQQHRALADGDLPSKSGMFELIGLGLAEKDYSLPNPNAITAKGLMLFQPTKNQ